jgi:hypothetical protein
MENFVFKLVFSLFLFIALSLFLLPPAQAGPRLGKEQIKAIMIGDRLVDIAYNLGVVPEAMSIRCSWPAVSNHLRTVRNLGCPRCVTVKKKGVVAKVARKLGIKKIMVEKSKNFCLYRPNMEPMKILPLLEGKGFDVQVVDFSQGIESAIRQTGKLVNREKKAEELIRRYNRTLKKFQNKLPETKLNKKVLILNGIVQEGTAKGFIQVLASNGYEDRFFLEPMGCTNVGNLIKPKGTKVKKGVFPLQRLENIGKAMPDVIIITGKAFAVQNALRKSLKKNPSLSEVPAIKNHEIYSLPRYIDSSVMEYPQILRVWTRALYK